MRSGRRTVQNAFCKVFPLATLLRFLLKTTAKCQSFTPNGPSNHEKV